MCKTRLWDAYWRLDTDVTWELIFKFLFIKTNLEIVLFWFTSQKDVEGLVHILWRTVWLSIPKKEMYITLEGTRQNNEKQQKQGGSVIEWSARRTRNPAVPGSKVAMGDTFFTSPAGDRTAI